MRLSRPDFEYKPRTPESRRSSEVSDIRSAPKTRPPSERPTRPSSRTRQDDGIIKIPSDPGATTPEDVPGSGGDDPGGDPGGGDDGGGDDDRDPDIIIYCHCCGLPWWQCMWCHYWTPLYWHYCCYDPYYWEDYWYCKKWKHSFVEYHHYYDFVTEYPNIYTPPALTLDPNSEAIQYLDEGANLFRNGHYLEALHQFRLATLVDLNFAIPKFAYAQALFALGIYDYAAYEIRLGLDLLPDWLEIGGDVRLMYGNTADFDEQLAALTSHLKVWPDDEDSILVLGYISFFSGDVYMAQKAFEKLTASFTYNNRYIAGLFLEAIENIKARIAAQDPNNDLLKDDDVTLDELLQN